MPEERDLLSLLPPDPLRFTAICSLKLHLLLCVVNQRQAAGLCVRESCVHPGLTGLIPQQLLCCRRIFGLRDCKTTLLCSAKNSNKIKRTFRKYTTIHI